jgi:hypothetical protein
MRQRCLNKKSEQYKNWGGRGIKICDKWLKFEGFLEDMGERPENKTLDRKDNNGNYCKENCRWATVKQQCNNTRRNIKINGMSIADFSKKIGIREATLRSRISTGWSMEEILSGKRKISKYELGEFKNAEEVAKYFKIHRVRVYQRFWEGWKIIGDKFVKN